MSSGRRVRHSYFAYLLFGPIIFLDGLAPLPSPAKPTGDPNDRNRTSGRSEEHTSELQSLMRISYAVFCLKKKINHHSQYYTIVSNQHTTKAFVCVCVSCKVIITKQRHTYTGT